MSRSKIHGDSNSREYYYDSNKGEDRDRKQRRERKLKTEGIQKRGGNKKER